MHAVYMKFYGICLVLKIVCASYEKYVELLVVQPTPAPQTEGNTFSNWRKWNNFFTPVWLTIPFSIAAALTHLLMIMIIAVRIYVDNFAIENDGTNSNTSSTGDYRVAPLTGYMIACTIYLPIASWITFIIVNKSWFYEVYSAIKNKRADDMSKSDKKLHDFIEDPWAYLATVLLMVPFIVFIVGAYIPDYDSSDYEVASSAREAVHGLGFFLIAFFFLSNIQATVVLLIVLCVVCGFPILCIALCYFRYYSHNGNNINTFDGNDSIENNVEGNINFDYNNSIS